MAAALIELVGTDLDRLQMEIDKLALYLGDRLFVMAPRPGRIHSTYELPFARQALDVEPREMKASREFIEKREEILSIIWEMEEEIMGRQVET